MTDTTTPTADFHLADCQLTSRLLLGTAQYVSPQVLSDAITAADAEVLTLSLKRQTAHGNITTAWWQHIENKNKKLLPNTAGCRTAEEAIQVALMARELYNTTWIKLEVTSDDYSLQPNPFELVKASEALIQSGFEVFPYCTEDLTVAEHLVHSGCRILMPWAAPIGSGQGLSNPNGLKRMRHKFPNTVLIIDAGIGAPSHAAQAMEMGFDAVLLNSAIAQSQDAVGMAAAFKHAIIAGRMAYLSGIIATQDFATPSTPNEGQPFMLL